MPVENLLSSICESLVNVPPICQEILNITPSEGSNFGTLMLICFLILIMTVLAFYYLRRSLRREMQEKVQKDATIMIQQYSALKNERTDFADSADNLDL